MQVLGNQGIQHNLLTLTGVLFNTVLILVFLPVVLGLENMGKLFFLYEIALFLFPIMSVGISGLPGFYLPKLLPNSKNDHGLTILSLVLLLILVFLFGWLLLAVDFNAYTFVLGENSYSTWFLTLLLILFLAYNQFFAMYSHYLNQRINLALLIQTTKFTIPVLGFLYYFEFFNFDTFLILFVLTFALPGIWQFWSIIKSSFFTIRINLIFFKSTFSKWLVKNSLLYWWGGISFVLFSKADVVILALALNFDQLAVYIMLLSITYFMHIPKSILGAVTGTVISYALKRNDTVHLQSIYKKSAVGLTIVGIVMVSFFYFVGWELLGLLPLGSSIQTSFFVLILLAIGKLITQSIGVSDILIAKSPFEKVLIPFQFIAGLINVFLAIILVPWYGIVGAAFSSLVTSIIFSLFMYIFLRFKYSIQPFSKDFIRLIIVTLIIFPIFAVGKFYVAGGKWGLVFFLLFLSLYSYTIYKQGISNDFTYWVSKSKAKILEIIKTGF